MNKMKKTLYNHLINLLQCNPGSKRIIEFYSLSILVSLKLNLLSNNQSIGTTQTDNITNGDTPTIFPLFNFRPF
ncbi:hypothetical protein MHK_004929 [Candidatus Magnetomorum sp. HK-1]|nr:hypothetical protein MHK_004929 [Candidatus Magnetomorum sp. HK-1]